MVDVAVSRMMGLVVVARLAARHGVKVELRPGSERGTVAEVTLPTSVLVPRALAGRNRQPPAAPAPRRPAGHPAGRPRAGRSARPLALESGAGVGAAGRPAAPDRPFGGRPGRPAPAPRNGFGRPRHGRRRPVDAGLVAT